MAGNESFAALTATLKRAVAALREAEVPFALAGSFAAWARGGPRPENDLDLMMKPSDAQDALQALADSGMRTERPPEDWLFKAFDGDVLVDLIFRPAGLELTDEVLGRAEPVAVLGLTVPVLAAEDVLATKLAALNEHALDYSGLVGISRAVREQVDWPRLRRRTCTSPYARAFFTLAEGLGISELEPERPAGGAQRARRVRVVGGAEAGATPPPDSLPEPD